MFNVLQARLSSASNVNISTYSSDPCPKGSFLVKRASFGFFGGLVKAFLMLLVTSSFSVAHAWWMPTEGIRVICHSYASEEVPALNIQISGRMVEIEKVSQKDVFEARIYQTYNSKVWETSQISLAVALVPSSWGVATHVGTLTYKSKNNPIDIGLWCVPENRN